MIRLTGHSEDRPRRASGPVSGFACICGDERVACLEGIDMDALDQVKKLREEYERALDAAEAHRVAYHEAVLDLYRSGTPLREIAKELGLSHQRVHQIVSGDPPRHRNLGRVAGGIAGVLVVLIAATLGALRVAHAPPFGQTMRVPPAANSGTAVAIDPRTGAILQHGTEIVIDPATGKVVPRR